MGAKRSVLVNSECFLHTKHFNMYVQDDIEDQFVASYEDLNVIIVDNNKSNMSVNFMRSCLENDTTIVVCDEKHMPVGQLLKYSNNVECVKILKSQFDLGSILKGNLVQEIIKQKILNYSRLLKIFDKNEKSNVLGAKAGSVKRNDKDYVEGVAAGIFFRCAYGENFNRDKDCDDIINKHLNFGYMILTSLIARSCAKYGLDMRLGILHHNKSNQINLACDLVEPFRALIDYYVMFNLENLDSNITPRTKRDITKLLKQPMYYGEIKMTVEQVIDAFVRDFRDIIVSKKELTELKEVKLAKIRMYEL